MEEGGRVNRQRRGGIFSSFLMVALLLIVTTIFFFAFVAPSIRSFSAHIFRPNSFKKRWESLNMMLVLVAAAFAFLSKIQNDQNRHDQFQSSSSLHDHISSSPTSVNVYHKNSMLLLRRNSRSYPDLRDFSSNPWDYGIYRRRAFGDVWDTRRHRRSQSMEEAATTRKKVITVPVTTPSPFPPREKNRLSPPPPPPPGFYKPWKFVVRGDHVMVDSPSTSSSDLDDVYSDATSATTSDVNSKAESFINDFRAKLKRQVGLSSLSSSQI